LLSDPEDLETLVRGVGIVRRIMAAGPMHDLIGEEVSPGGNHRTDEALRKIVPASTGIAYHPSGTCRMGSDSAAVVTPQLLEMTLPAAVVDERRPPLPLRGEAGDEVAQLMPIELAAHHAFGVLGGRAAFRPAAT